MGESTLTVLAESMTLIVQRLNKLIMPWLVAWFRVLCLRINKGRIRCGPLGLIKELRSR